MQHLEVSCAVRRFFKSLGFKGLITYVSLMYELKKNGNVFTTKFVRTGPLSYKKKTLPGRGLTKVEKHYPKMYRESNSCEYCKLNLHRECCVV